MVAVVKKCRTAGIDTLVDLVVPKEVVGRRATQKSLLPVRLACERMIQLTPDLKGNGLTVWTDMEQKMPMVQSTVSEDQIKGGRKVLPSCIVFPKLT